MSNAITAITKEATVNGQKVDNWIVDKQKAAKDNV
jgi:hypothetical protein